MNEIEELKKTIYELSERVSILEHRLNIINNSEPKQTDEKRDKTKYIYNGAIYSKNRIVLQIINEYVKLYPQITFENLSNIFDKSLQGSIGVIVPLTEAQKRKDINKRFFAKENEIINLDIPCVVCTQWGIFNIVKFIARAKQLGFGISEIN